MLEIKAVVSDPCQTCRAMALILLFVAVTQLAQNFEAIDFFGLRHQFGPIPPVVDLASITTFTFVLWILCERVVVGKILRGCDKAGKKNRGASPPGTTPVSS